MLLHHIAEATLALPQPPLDLAALAHRACVACVDEDAKADGNFAALHYWHALSKRRTLEPALNQANIEVSQQGISVMCDGCSMRLYRFFDESSRGERGFPDTPWPGR
jgi:hypothetical protein